MEYIKTFKPEYIVENFFTKKKMEQGPRRKKKEDFQKYKNPVLVKCEILNNVSDIKFNLKSISS